MLTALPPTNDAPLKGPVPFISDATPNFKSTTKIKHFFHFVVLSPPFRNVKLRSGEV